MAGPLEPLEPPAPLTQLLIRLIPRVGEPLAKYRDDRYQQRVKVMAEQMSDVTGLEPLELLERAAANEPLAEMFEHAFNAGMGSSFEDKRRLLARALAQGFADGADLDSNFVLVKVIAELEPPHVKVLDRMVDAELAGGPRLHPTDIVSEAYTSGAEVAPAITSSLAQLGLIESQATWDGHNVYNVSRLGYRVISLLRDKEVPPPVLADEPVGGAAADVSISVSQVADPYNQSVREVFAIHNAGPGVASNVDLSFDSVTGLPFFVGEVFPWPQLRALEDFEVEAHWSAGDPSPPYKVTLRWEDGRGPQSSTVKLMPRLTD